MNAMEQAKKRWDAIAKPLHSLGRLEDLIVQIAGVQGTPDVRMESAQGLAPVDGDWAKRQCHRAPRRGSRRAQ